MTPCYDRRFLPVFYDELARRKRPAYPARGWRHVPRNRGDFAARTLLMQTLGFKAARMEIDFDSHPVIVEELFSVLEKLCGG